ncbi:hexokinase, partial [Gregarina niphandrodes]
RYLDSFEMDRYAREQLMSGLQVDVNQGLESKRSAADPRQSDLYMLDTCVTGGPKGTETGVFYAVDFGGTNLRCVRTELKGDGKYELDQISRDIREIPTKGNLPRGLMDKGATATELFDHIALMLLELMRRSQDDEKGTFYKVGFTFSFAINQLGIDRAEALSMSKGFETGQSTNDPVVRKGTDIVLLLNKALLRNSVPAEAVAVLNDTTGTLIAGAYTRPQDYPDALVGVIIGTGMNICYVEPDARQYLYQGSVINTEAGALKKGLPRNIVDHEVDDASSPMGAQLCEKMVSGLYLPEICRRLILKVFQCDAPPLAWAHNSMTTHACMRIAYDETKELSDTRDALSMQLEWPEVKLTWEVLEICHNLCRAACRRSAAIMSCLIATFAKRTGRLQPALGGVTVAIDGSVYTKNPEYQKDFRQELEKTVGKDLADLIKVTIATDGSGAGAAILAATPKASSEPGLDFSVPAERLWQQKHND